MEDTVRVLLNKLNNFLLESSIGLKFAAKKASIELNSRLDGKRIRKSIQYVRNGKKIQAFCEKQKSWWNHLRNGAPVDIKIDGQTHHGWAVVIEEKNEIIRSWENITKAIDKRIRKILIGSKKEVGNFGVDEKRLHDFVLISVELS